MPGDRLQEARTPDDPLLGDETLAAAQERLDQFRRARAAREKKVVPRFAPNEPPVVDDAPFTQEDTAPSQPPQAEKKKPGKKKKEQSNRDPGPAFRADYTAWHPGVHYPQYTPPPPHWGQPSVDLRGILADQHAYLLAAQMGSQQVSGSTVARQDVGVVYSPMPVAVEPSLPQSRREPTPPQGSQKQPEVEEAKTEASKSESKPRMSTGAFTMCVGAVAVAVTATSLVVASYKSQEVCSHPTDMAVGAGCWGAGIGGQYIQDALGNPRNVWESASGWVRELGAGGSNPPAEAPNATHPSVQPKTQPEIAPEEIEKLNATFAESIPLGSIDATLSDGKAEVAYGKKSVQLPMQDERTTSFVAEPASQTLFTVTRSKDGSKYIVGYDRSKMLLRTNLEAAPGFKVDGTAKSGFTATNGSTTITFANKAPASGSDAAANNANSIAMPANKDQAEVIAKLYGFKAELASVGAFVTGKCLDSATGTPLQAASAIEAAIDTKAQNTVREWGRANGVDITFEQKGKYSFDAKAILEQSAKKASTSSDAALKQTADDLVKTLSKQADDFSVSGKWSCTASQ